MRVTASLAFRGGPPRNHLTLRVLKAQGGGGRVAGQGLTRVHRPCGRREGARVGEDPRLSLHVESLIQGAGLRRVEKVRAMVATLYRWPLMTVVSSGSSPTFPARPRRGREGVIPDAHTVESVVDAVLAGPVRRERRSACRPRDRLELGRAGGVALARFQHPQGDGGGGEGFPARWEAEG